MFALLNAALLPCFGVLVLAIALLQVTSNGQLSVNYLTRV